MDEGVILRTQNLGKRFGKRWAVSGVDLAVRRGEIFGFLGPNGAGKSTTIRMLLTLVTPSTGWVEFFGKPLLRHRNAVLKRVGGLVERPDFYLYLSARRNLQIVAGLLEGIGQRDIDEVLDMVGLLGRADDKVKTYSHGMRQRLGIAQALLGRPEFIVLDEPTSGLDPQGIKEVRDLVRRLSTERSITVFLSSHLLHEIELTATNMAIINNGVLVVQGSVRELLADGPQRLRVVARPVTAATAVLKTLPGVSIEHTEGESIECRTGTIPAAEINRTLVNAGVDVQALIPRRSLEEYFLSITEGATEVPSRRGAV